MAEADHSFCCLGEEYPFIYHVIPSLQTIPFVQGNTGRRDEAEAPLCGAGANGHW